MLIRLVRFPATIAARRDDRGNTAVDRSLVAAIVAVVIIAAFATLGRDMSAIFAAAAASM